MPALHTLASSVKVVKKQDLLPRLLYLLSQLHDFDVDKVSVSVSEKLTAIQFSAAGFSEYDASCTSVATEGQA